MYIYKHAAIKRRSIKNIENVHHQLWFQIIISSTVQNHAIDKHEQLLSSAAEAVTFCMSNHLSQIGLFVGCYCLYPNGWTTTCLSMQHRCSSVDAIRTSADLPALEDTEDTGSRWIQKGRGDKRDNQTQCNVNLRTLPSAHKSCVRATSPMSLYES